MKNEKKNRNDGIPVFWYDSTKASHRIAIYFKCILNSTVIISSLCILQAYIMHIIKLNSLFYGKNKNSEKFVSLSDYVHNECRGNTKNVNKAISIL